MNILYVEDETNDVRLMALFVRTTPHRLLIAENIEEARKVVLDDIGLILADVLLENAQDGYVLIQEFRSKGCKCPMIAVTALSTPRDVQACQEAGFDHILHKPFGIEQLAEVISKYTA